MNKVIDKSVYYHHIFDAIEKINKYVAAYTFDRFAKNDLVIDAVVRELEIIGEAASHVFDELKQSHPEIPWRDVVSMRNKLIHEYFNVSVEVVWQVATVDLIVLQRAIAEQLN